MKAEVTGFVSTHFVDGRREALIVLNDQLCFGYVNIPEALEQELADLGPGAKADALYVERIAGKYSEHAHPLTDFHEAQMLAIIYGHL
jgi:hypothetical protein